MADKFFRVRWRLLGVHYHCRVFSVDRPDRTFAKLGDLVQAGDTIMVPQRFL